MEDKDSINDFVRDLFCDLNTQPSSPDAEKAATQRPNPETGNTEALGALPGHLVEKLIARGGMGAVYLARQHALEREVAVKVMTREANSPEMAARFRREAIVLGRLAHPNIVPVYDVGTDEDGQLFYTMKLVKGRTLQDILHDLRREDPEALKQHSLASLLSVFRKVCDAMAFAHSHGILHRDLKPENIMVGEFGEVLVMDWGLAKLLHGEDGVQETNIGTAPDRSSLGIPAPSFGGTLSGSVMGTPHYMSPEQARGEIDELDDRSDIFSLGGILYAILTLRPPVEGTTMEEVLNKVSSGEITSPSALATRNTPRGEKRERDEVLEAATIKPLPHMAGGRVPNALSAVVMKALALDKEGRYRSVVDLGKDIGKHQSGFATSAESIGAAGQLALFIKRNKGVSIATATSLLLIIVVSAGFIAKVREEASKAVAASEQMEIERDAARAAEASTQISLAEAALTNGNLRLVSGTLATVPEEFRNDDWHYLQDQIHTEFIPIEGRLANIIAACPHPLRPSTYVVMDAKGAMSLVNAATGEHVFEYPHVLPEPMLENSWPERKALAISADGRRLAVAHAGKITILDGETGEIEGEWKGRADLAFNWSQDGRFLSTQYGILDITTGRELWISATQEDLNGKNKWGYESRFIFYLHGTKNVLELSNSRNLVRDNLTGKVLRRLERSKVSVAEAAISPDQEAILLRRYSSGVVEVQQIRDGAIREITSGLNLKGLGFSHDGQRILAVGFPNDRENHIKSYHRASSWLLETRLLDQAGPMRVHPLSGDVLILGESARAVPLSSRAPWITFHTQSDVLWKFDFIGSDKWFLGPVTRSDALQEFKPFKQEAKKQRFFWNLDADQDSIRAHPSPPKQLQGNYHRAIYATEDGSRFAAFSWNDTVAMFEREDGAENYVFLSEGELMEKPIPRRLSFDPGVSRFWSNDGIWDAMSRELILRLTLPEDYQIERTIWLPDGSGLVGLARKPNTDDEEAFTWKAIRWDAATGAVLQSQELPCAMNMLKLSPDTRQIALAGADMAVHFIDAMSLEPMGRLRAHNGEVLHVAWHPTRPILATSSSDLATKFWNVEDKHLLETIWAPQDKPNSIGFSPSGKLFLCHATSGNLFVFDVRDYLGVAKTELRVEKSRKQPPADTGSELPPLHQSLLPRKTYKTGEWIPTLDSELPLREYDGFKEISRDADLRIQDMGQQEVWHKKADYLMGGEVPDTDFLFHTLSGGMPHPHIVIRLKSESKIRALKVVNRTNTDMTLIDRARDLNPLDLRRRDIVATGLAGARRPGRVDNRFAGKPNRPLPETWFTRQRHPSPQGGRRLRRSCRKGRLISGDKPHELILTLRRKATGDTLKIRAELPCPGLEPRHASDTSSVCSGRTGSLRQHLPHPLHFLGNVSRVNQRR